MKDIRRAPKRYTIHTPEYNPLDNEHTSEGAATGVAEALRLDAKRYPGSGRKASPERQAL